MNENIESDAYLGEIKRRMDKCFSHERCCETLSGHRQIDSRQVILPTRCIDVLDPGLHIAETGSVTSSYLILSHRWTPDTAACATTASNIELRRQGDVNALSSLPKTFRDVFDIARGLGVRYVWIDSLCIIQHGDSGQDWIKEAPKMGDYYQQAMLTICATSNSSGTGIFPERTHFKSTPEFARLPFRNKAGERQGFFYVYSHDDENVNEQVDEEMIQGSDLFTRGWVLQEWLLSRRLVYFTPSGMIYECMTGGMSDDRGEVWASKKTAKGLFPYVPLYSWTVPGTPWYRIVELYSSKSLTFPEKDHIVALAGVAKEFGDLLRRFSLHGRVPVTTVPCGLEYVSGLWAYDLHLGLLWERKAFSGRHQRLNVYPSWSWTSVLGPVVWDTNPVEARARGLFERSFSKSLRGYVTEKKPPIYPEVKFLALSTREGIVLSLSGPPSEAADRFTAAPLDAFNTLNKFAALRISGKLVRFVIQEGFSEDEDMQILFNLCGEAIDNTSAQRFWRKVCTMENPAEITGWSSIEHPDYQEEVSYEGGLEVFTLLVTTSAHDHGYGLGFYGLSTNGFYTVYHVLFVRELYGGRFERMGVGRVFGKDVDKAFQRTDVKELELI